MNLVCRVLGIEFFRVSFFIVVDDLRTMCPEYPISTGLTLSPSRLFSSSMAIEPPTDTLSASASSSDSGSISTNLEPTESKPDTYAGDAFDLEFGLNTDPFTTNSTLPLSPNKEGVQTLRANRLGRLRQRLRTASLLGGRGGSGSETTALARAHSSFTNLLDAQKASLDGGSRPVSPRNAPSRATTSTETVRLRLAGLGCGYESDSAGATRAYSPCSSRPSLGGIDEDCGGTVNARRTFDVPAPARAVVHRQSRISYEMGAGSESRKGRVEGEESGPAGVDVGRTPVGRRSVERIWGMRLKLALPAKDKLSSGLSSTLYSPRPRVSFIRGLVETAEPGESEEAGVGVCGTGNETLGPCVGGGNESGSRVTGSSRALASSSSKSEQQSRSVFAVLSALHTVLNSLDVAATVFAAAACCLALGLRVLRDELGHRVPHHRVLHPQHPHHLSNSPCLKRRTGDRENTQRDSCTPGVAVAGLHLGPAQHFLPRVRRASAAYSVRTAESILRGSSVIS